MTDPNQAPAASELPSSGRLLRSTLIAAVVATVLLITVVLPAEYGVDPTRVGSVLGLTRMGEIKTTLAKEAAIADSVEPRAASAPTPAPSASVDSSINNHVTEVVLRPSEGKEIKLVMRKAARATYSWSTNRGVVNYDTHADAPGINYHGYSKGKEQRSDNGVLVAAFDGEHGWFWRNRGRESVTVTLTTQGDYEELKRK